jgi:hypothetical protein
LYNGYCCTAASNSDNNHLPLPARQLTNNRWPIRVNIDFSKTSSLNKRERDWTIILYRMNYFLIAGVGQETDIRP